MLVNPSRLDVRRSTHPVYVDQTDRGKDDLRPHRDRRDGPPQPFMPPESQSGPLHIEQSYGVRLILASLEQFHTTTNETGGGLLEANIRNKAASEAEPAE